MALLHACDVVYYITNFISVHKIESLLFLYCHLGLFFSIKHTKNNSFYFFSYLRKSRTYSPYFMERDKKTLPFTLFDMVEMTICATLNLNIQMYLKKDSSLIRAYCDRIKKKSVRCSETLMAKIKYLDSVDLFVDELF